MLLTEALHVGATILATNGSGTAFLDGTELGGALMHAHDVPKGSSVQRTLDPAAIAALQARQHPL